eukprot:Trichotokara_eunicae@DN4452_c0_g1_i1.p1
MRIWYDLLGGVSIILTERLAAHEASLQIDLTQYNLRKGHYRVQCGIPGPYSQDVVCFSTWDPPGNLEFKTNIYSDGEGQVYFYENGEKKPAPKLTLFNKFYPLKQDWKSVPAPIVLSKLVT